MSAPRCLMHARLPGQQHAHAAPVLQALAVQDPTAVSLAAGISPVDWMNLEPLLGDVQRLLTLQHVCFLCQVTPPCGSYGSCSRNSLVVASCRLHASQLCVCCADTITPGGVAEQLLAVQQEADTLVQAISAQQQQADEADWVSCVDLRACLCIT